MAAAGAGAAGGRVKGRTRAAMGAFHAGTFMHQRHKLRMGGIDGRACADIVRHIQAGTIVHQRHELRMSRIDGCARAFHRASCLLGSPRSNGSIIAGTLMHI